MRHLLSSEKPNWDSSKESFDFALYIIFSDMDLVFRPQKEIIYNKLLPYSDRLDDESLAWFKEIKANLAKSLALREIRPGFITWISRLSKYLRIYGLKFTKEDHIALIKLLNSFIYSPDLEPWLVNKAGYTLISLLKKKELIEPHELTLEWRPLYDLYERLLYSPYEPHGMLQFPP